ncbi:caspase family protein [Actinokineospora sp. PR83]|uniref:caspase family protein n=1 Tax=Actinokineospora sp. PR83 TaxID=2884908 RepID=UPI001F3C487A|nr:caspase family protein [Actinokineospora sp. PR83]MCG8915225.1 caspase family protein [Actinokineospora sp. PR83]
MARRALLIGSETGGLSGPGHDTAAMATTLARWGFTPVVCEGENASRAGILDAYERLISQSRPDDAAVVYYSGHGAYAKDPSLAEGMPGPGVVQFIIPTDFEESCEDDFRGIANVELSVLLDRLTARTPNAAVVLDCCHSGAMSRDPETGAVPKVWPRAVPGHLARAHLDSLHRGGADLRGLHPGGNQNAVRIVACAMNQRAYEAPNADGVSMGYLTDALTRALDTLDPEVGRWSWATVVDRVRMLVLDRCGVQRPEVEGPGERELFGTEPVEQVASLPASRQRQWVRIAGARLLGYGAGDEFAIHHHDVPLGAVVVEWTDGHAAFGRLRGPDPELELPVGARAQLVATSVPTLPVSLGAGLESLAQDVLADPVLRLASAGETAPVRVVADSEGVALHDAVGPLSRSKPAAHDLLGDLRRVARARAVLRLSEDPGMALPARVRVELARVVDGVAHPLPACGAVLHPGQAVCVAVRNEGEQYLYVSLLDIGVSSQVTLLNPAHPSGVPIAPGKQYVFGGDDVTGALPGMELSWPSSVPPVGPRRESIVVLISEERADAVLLQQGGVRAGRPLNRLEQQLWRLGAQSSREITPMLTRSVRFAVRTVDFDVVPTPAPYSEKAVFEVDDRPDSATPPGEVGEPTRVVLRMPTLVLHHNRSFRSQDFRLDTLVVTTGADGEIRHHNHTARFTGTVDGTRLVIGGDPVFEGDVRERLDVAVWVSSARGEGADLSAVTGESTARVVDATEALLAAGADRVIGLYRAGFRADERFGAARLGAESTVRTADFTFDLTVEEVPARGPSVLR